MAELLEADPADLLGDLHETLVSRDVARRDAGDLRLHRLRVTVVAEGLAVVEADRVERVERAHRDVVLHALAADLPQLREEVRRGDQGRACVEGEAALAEDPRPPAGLVELLEHGDAIAARAEADRGGEAAEARADHHGVGTLRRLSLGAGRAEGEERRSW